MAEIGVFESGELVLENEVDLADPWPRAYVACRVAEADSKQAALLAPYREGFEPGAQVALEGEGAATCRSGRARRIAFVPGLERSSADWSGNRSPWVSASPRAA